MMTVTIELTDYSQPIKPPIRIHSAWKEGNKKGMDCVVEFSKSGTRYQQMNLFPLLREQN